MLVLFDYHCPTCHKPGQGEERMVRGEEADEQECKCGQKMVRLPAGTRTTFRFADARYRA